MKRFHIYTPNKMSVCIVYGDEITRTDVDITIEFKNEVIFCAHPDNAIVEEQNLNANN